MRSACPPKGLVSQCPTIFKADDSVSGAELTLCRKPIPHINVCTVLGRNLTALILDAPFHW